MRPEQLLMDDRVTCGFVVGAAPYTQATTVAWPLAMAPM